MKQFKKAIFAFVLTLGLMFLMGERLQAQVDTTKKDTVVAPMDTTVKHVDTTVKHVDTTATSPAAAPAAVATTAAVATAPTEKPPKKSTFIIYAGPNVSTLHVESADFEKESKTGYHVGLSWRRSGFVFTQLGVRYNSPVYSVFKQGRADSGDHKFSISDIDVPVTVGLNLLSGRLLGLRAFISAVPAFNLSVGDNDQGVSKDNINTFVFYGQVGIGVDVLFLSIDLGYNYGFSDIIKDYNSKPGQGFLNIGFKF
jgi:hypothetical protein